MSRNRRAQKSRTHRTTYEVFEPRQLLASVGWDGPGLGGAELTYYVGNAPTGITQTEFEATVENALQVWADEIDVSFTQTNLPNQPDSIDFTSRPIDGTNGILAQAYFPDDLNRGSIAGDVRFDSMDNWEVGNEQGYRATDLMYVAVHEIGHSLGIEHLDDHDSVLASTVSANQSFEGLSQHDIDAAMELYAPAAVTPQTPTIIDPVQNDPLNPTNDADSNEDGIPTVEQPSQQPEEVSPETDGPEVQDPTTDDQDSGHHEEDDSDERKRRRRFWRILNHFARRMRFSFWPQISFIRW